MKRILMLLLVLLIIFSLAACGGSNQSAGQKAPEEKTSDVVESVVIAITKDENSLTPFTYVTATGSVVNRLIYDTLLTTDLENNIIPWMVEEDYKIEDGYKKFTFTLIEGQKFHDGTPVTTADVEYSFMNTRKSTNDIEEIKIADERTMTIILKNPDINYLRKALVGTRIICKAQYENVEDPKTVNDPIGSGMYRLKEYKVGEYYIFEAMDDYFKGTPKVKTINMPIMGDSAAVQTALLSDQIAAATSNIGVEMIDTFKAKEGMEIKAGAGYSPMIMNFNNGVAPFNDSAFRNALTYAIDVKGIMTTLYGEYCTIGTKGVIRPDMPYAVAGLDYVFDTEKANAILDEAGYEKGADGIRIDKNGDPCNVEILVYSGSTVRIRAAELASEQLKAIGVNMEVKVMEMDTVDAYVWPDFDVSKGRDYDASMWGWGTSINPNFLVGLFSSDFKKGGCNVCGYKNDEMDAVINDKYAKALTDEALYEALKEMQKIAAEDPSFICFGFADALQACNMTLYNGFVSGKGTNVVNIFSFLDVE